MKKNTLYAGIALLAALVSVFFLIGCSQENNAGAHTDPSFLIGTWFNTLATFKIDENYDFYCDLSADSLLGNPARVYGTLVYDRQGLGPNDYIMKDMRAAGVDDPTPDYTQGNADLEPQLAEFQDLLGTLTPNNTKDQFTFTSTSPAAEMFFGGAGPYDKQIE